MFCLISEKGWEGSFPQSNTKMQVYWKDGVQVTIVFSGLFLGKNCCLEWEVSCLSPTIRPTPLTVLKKTIDKNNNQGTWYLNVCRGVSSTCTPVCMVLGPWLWPLCLVRRDKECGGSGDNCLKWWVCATCWTSPSLCCGVCCQVWMGCLILQSFLKNRCSKQRKD